MKKYIKFRFLLFTALLLILSCDSNQTEVIEVIGTDGYPIATFVVTGTTVDETGGGIVYVDITFDKMIDRGVNFSATQVGGDAVENEDYIVNDVILEAFTTTAQMTIVIYEDEIPEGDETLVLQIDRPSLASKFLINPVSILPEISITISNYKSNSLDLSCDWETGIPYAGDVYGACANIDIDVLISPLEGFDINDPWASDILDWGGATGNCPEELSLDLDDWDDGEYVVWADLYENGFYGLDTDTDVPITTRATRAGVFSQVVDQDESQWMNSDDAGYIEDGATHGIVLYVKIEGGVFTVINYDGDIEAMGKATNSDKTKTQRPVNPNKTGAEKREGLVK